jgi:hypothetical protein
VSELAITAMAGTSLEHQKGSVPSAPAGRCPADPLLEVSDTESVGDVLIVRACKGLVRETERVSHVVVLGPGDATRVPQALRAHCGVVFAPGEAELMPGIGGMPCTVCLGVIRLSSRTQAVPLQRYEPSLE